MRQRAQPPELGSARAFAFPGFTRERAPDALELIHCELPGRPLGAAVLTIDAGAVHEATPGAAGLAAAVLREGTEHRDGPALAESVERLGARLFTWSDWDDYGVLVTAPVGHLPAAIELVAEVVREPAFADADVERLRGERLNHLRQMRAQGGMRAHLAFPSAVFEHGTYARDADGDEAAMTALTVEDLRAHHGTFATPDAATLVVAGGLPVDDARAAAEAFEGWTPAPPTRAPADPGPRTGGRLITLIDRPGSVQSDLLIGHAGIARAAPEHTAAELAFAVLGGMFNSRLMRSLREEKGYTYGVNASLDAGRFGGTLAVGSAVHGEHTVPSIEMILTELDALASAGITKAELEDARDYLTGVFPLRNETARSIAGLLAEQVTCGLPDDAWDRAQRERAALSVEGVGEAIARVLRPDELSLIVVGDAGEHEPALRALGEVEVVSDA